MSIIARHSGSDAWRWRWMIRGSVWSSQRRLRKPVRGSLKAACSNCRRRAMFSCTASLFERIRFASRTSKPTENSCEDSASHQKVSSSSTRSCVGFSATATVAAEKPTQLLVLDEETFWWLAESSHEFSVGLLVRLAKRMRSNNDAVQENIALRRQFEQAALSDALSGFRNRRWLEQTLPLIVQRHLHASEPLCIAMMDVDHFKQVNDAYGHAAGDAVLLQVGQLVRANLRPADFAARIGGEEFVLVFPQTSMPGAISAAERLREAIADAALDYDGHPLPQVTVSLGLVALERSANSLELLARADDALYAAKQSGRNRTEWPGREGSGHKLNPGR